MRRMCNRSQHLGGPDIRASIHSYSAIGIRQRRRPFDSVVAVVRFVQEGIPFAVRCVASANILVDYDVTAGCTLMAEIDVTVAVFVVRSSREKNGKFSWRRWPVNISAKYGAVAHRHRDAVFHSHGIGIGCKSRIAERESELRTCRAEQLY